VREDFRMDVDLADYGAGPDKSPDENWAAYLRGLKAVKEAGGGTITLTAGKYAAGDLTGLDGVEIRGANRG
jgi:polygalacturonase